MTDPAPIAKKIFDLRRLKGLNQAELADKVGISRAAISLYEKGKSNPTHKILTRLAEALDTDVAFLLGMGSAKAPNDAHAVGLLSDIPVIELRRVSFRARASFNYMQLQRHLKDDLLDTVLFRLPPGRTEEDYKDALVFDIEGDSMEPSLRDGQQVIAWPVPESKWEHLHNTICVVDYDDTVTVKAIFKNDLFNTDGLTLHATGGRGGEFRVAQSLIHSIWEVREFYGVVPVRLVA